MDRAEDEDGTPSENPILVRARRRVSSTGFRDPVAADRPLEVPIDRTGKL